MGWFMDVLDLLIVAFLLVAGMTCAIFGARMLRRGDAVTAEEAVNWRRAVRKQGFDALPEMNPDITDILVRAWRTLPGWYLLCAGIGGMLAGAGTAVFLAARGGGRYDYVTGMLFLAAFLYPGVLVGVIVGLARIPRNPRATVDGGILPRAWRLFRLPLVAWYPAAALAVNVILMTILVLRLAPGLDLAALARASALPGMWSVPIVPPILIAVTVSILLVKRWILTLAPLRLPQDADVRQQADGRLRKLALGMIYSMANYTAWLATFAQYILLTSGVYPDKPLLIARLDDWYFYLYFVLLIGGCLLAPMGLVFSGSSMAWMRETRSNRRSEASAAQSQQ